MQPRYHCGFTLPAHASNAQLSALITAISDFADPDQSEQYELIERSLAHPTTNLAQVLEEQGRDKTDLVYMTAEAWDNEDGSLTINTPESIAILCVIGDFLLVHNPPVEPHYITWAFADFDWRNSNIHDAGCLVITATEVEHFDLMTMVQAELDNA